ncbi:ArdC family protein [Sphingosinicella terrae]|uniref:ArdC family protein n=1 Tax=Sphingosinicella terrae TaxID=2172047 RepID=UPI000E0DA003|nr:zincin-like metallopeptidase domain-containing protein [Sphingosinicella terrae]
MKHSLGRPSPAETITAAVVKRLEAGTRPWVQPWTGASVSRPLRACGTPYQGINVLWLWMAAEAAGHTSPFWMTYRQAHMLGAQVRKGERGSIAIFYRTYLPREASADDEAEGDRTRRVLKSFTVFNACQVDGLPDRFFPEPQPLPPPTERDQVLDAFFSAIPARLRHFGAEAFYSPVSDQVTMPEPGLFRNLDHYRATLAHELSHWTGHEGRLARQMGGRFGSEAYAMEELVAELSSAILGAELGLPVEHLDHHASYLASWLKVLKADSRAIFTVAAKAEEAASLLLRLGRNEASADLVHERDAEDVQVRAA